MSRVLVAVLMSLCATLLAGCGRDDGAAVTAKTFRNAVLDAHDQPLRDDFNRDRGTIRLLFLVDPVCPECLRGLADMGDDLLTKLPMGAPVNVYVVHEPVIGGSSDDIRAAAALLRSPIARHYWNPSGDFGREMSHVLGYWNGARWVYAWDTWLIYPADATWTDSAPPQPVFLMHQLGGLPRNGKFPHLDPDVFAAKVQAMLPSLNAKNVSR